MPQRTKPIEEKTLNGNPGQYNLPTPIKGNPAKMNPPDNLGELAKQKWQELVSDLDAMSLLQNADRDMMMLYCDAWQRWHELKKIVEREGAIYETQSGNMIMSPAFSVMNRCAETMYKLAGDFGLTPVARTRIATNQNNKKDDPFEELLNYSKENMKGK